MGRILSFVPRTQEEADTKVAVAERAPGIGASFAGFNSAAGIQAGSRADEKRSEDAESHAKSARSSTGSPREHGADGTHLQMWNLSSGS